MWKDGQQQDGVPFDTGKTVLSSLTYLKDCDFYRNHSADLVLCCCIILFTESHDVYSLQPLFMQVHHGQLSGQTTCLHGIHSISITLMQCITLAPSAGPTGGAGLALPACSASLIRPVTAVHKFQSGASSYNIS